MSLILEALRKSEAERQRGQAPGLFVEQRPAAAPSRRARTPAWAWGIAVAFVLVLVAWGWREFGAARGPAGDAIATNDPVADVTAPVVSDAAPSPDAVTHAGDPNDHAPARAPEASAVREPLDAASPTMTMPPPAQATGPTRDSGVLPAMAGASDPTAAPAPAPPGLAAVDASPAATPVPDETAEQALADATAAPPPVAEETLPRLADLPAAERSQLPPFKLSMHVYADTPAQRFVILDGQRLAEGASPAAGVVVDQIRRDGLVLSVQGRRLLLARP